MLVTRATRRDLTDLQEFYAVEKWDDPILDRGVGFIARQGPIVGSVRLIEIDSSTLVLEDVLVASGRRREGVGTQLLQAAMNSRGGTMYVCCHDDVVDYYRRFGFEVVPFQGSPAEVQSHYRATGDAPDQLPDDHVHRFMRAR